MNHEELAEKLERRLERIEDKLDRHLENVTKNSAEIGWIKGYVKISFTAILALITGAVINILKLYKF